MDLRRARLPISTAEQQPDRHLLALPLTRTRSAINRPIPVRKLLVADAGAALERELAAGSPKFTSVYGTLFLAGSIAAARDEDRDTVRGFLTEADRSAALLGRDDNLLWTAFGPANVAIHRVATAMDLGDVQLAIEQAPLIDTTGLPVERQARHAIETARALSAWNRTDEALETLLVAEQLAPEQKSSTRFDQGPALC